MKGIILAGGAGTRLHPLTTVTNKHLLPVGRLPMIIHAINKLTESKIRDIMIVTGTEHMGDMITLLGSGRSYDCKITYKVQDEPNGIAGALSLCEDFINDKQCVVLLGDNIFDDSLDQYIQDYLGSNHSCFLLLKRVPDPERYGVAIIENGHLVGAVEKPKDKISDFCITGIYMYDASVFEKIKKLNPSARGEYEITELNHRYIIDGDVSFGILNGWWTDAGTFESYHLANRLLTRKNK